MKLFRTSSRRLDVSSRKYSGPPAADEPESNAEIVRLRSENESLRKQLKAKSVSEASAKAAAKAKAAETAQVKAQLFTLQSELAALKGEAAPVQDVASQLPEGWTHVPDDNGHIYYWNFVTGETTWEWPTAAGTTSSVSLPVVPVLPSASCPEASTRASNAEGERRQPIFVLDMGSSTCRIGLAEDDAPHTFPSIVGREKAPGLMVGSSLKAAHVGDEALSKRDILTLRYPIARGVVTNFDHAEDLWRHAFLSTLDVEPRGHLVVVTEPPNHPRAVRERIEKAILHHFGASHVSFRERSALALRAVGKQTGVVVHSGSQLTYVAAVVEGHPVSHATQVMHVAGEAMTEVLIRGLSNRGIGFLTPAAAVEALLPVKERHAEVMQADQTSLARAPLSLEALPEVPMLSHTLMDGTELTIGAERLLCGEVLFDPSIAGLSAPSLPMLLADAIGACDSELHTQLCQNIVLSGGTTLMRGFATRLKAELRNHFDQAMEVISPPEADRCHLAWLGGARWANDDVPAE